MLHASSAGLACHLNLQPRHKLAFVTHKSSLWAQLPPAVLCNTAALRLQAVTAFRACAAYKSFNDRWKLSFFFTLCFQVGSICVHVVHALLSLVLWCGQQHVSISFSQHAATLRLQRGQHVSARRPCTPVACLHHHQAVLGALTCRA